MKNIYTKIHDFWFQIPEKIRFVFIGGFNSLVSFVMFVFLIHFFAQFFVDDTTRLYNYIRIHHIPVLEHISFIQFIRQFSLALAWLLSSFVSFTTQRLLVFRAKGQASILKQYIKCLYTWFIGYLINAITLEIFAYIFEKIDLFPTVIETDIAQAFALVFSAISTYVLFKYFAFKKKKQHNSNNEII